MSKIILEKKEDGKWSVLEEKSDPYKKYRKMDGYRVSINMLDKGDIVRIINQETEDIIGIVKNIKGNMVYVHSDGLDFEAPINDVRLLDN